MKNKDVRKVRVGGKVRWTDGQVVLYTTGRISDLEYLGPETA